MKIFITGGSGFVGTVLVRELHKTKHTTHLLSARIEDEGAEREIKRFKPDVVIHLAWEGIPDYGAAMSAKNLADQLAFYGALKRVGCKKVIMTGTCWEYGAREGKLREDAARDPEKPFSAAKHALRVIGESFFDPETIVIWAHLFYVYGKGKNSASLIPHLIETAARGTTPELKTPKTANDFVHVDDVARALIALAEKKVPAGAYNIGSGKLTRVMDIVHMICTTFAVALPTGAQAIMRGTPKGFYADISKMQKATGWKPRVDINRGISALLPHATLARDTRTKISLSVSA